MALADAAGAQGRVERINGGVVHGWAWDPAAAGERVELRVWLDGQEVGATVAELPRPSLVTAGIGDGKHAFRFVLPASLASPGPHTLRVDAGGEPLQPASGFRVDGGENGDDPWQDASFTVEGPQLLSGPTHGAALDGRIEQVRNGIVDGWAWRPEAAEERLTLHVMLDAEDLGTAVAELPRPSLASAGIGDGRHAFRFVLPTGIATPGLHRLRIHSDGHSLPPAGGFIATAEQGEPWYAARFIVELGDEPEAATGRPPPPIAGVDGWLFASGAAGRWLEDDAVAATERNVATLLDALDKLEQRVGELGAKLLPVVCPVKEHACRERLPRSVREGLLRRPGDGLIRGLQAHRALDPLDLLPILELGAEQHSVYAPTSALLSEWGSYCAYRAIIKRVAMMVAGVTPPVQLDAASVKHVPSRRWEGRVLLATDLGLVECPPEALPEPAPAPVVPVPEGLQRTPHEHLARMSARFAAGWEQPEREELARCLIVGSPAHEAIAQWAARHFRFTVIVADDAAVIDVVSLERPDVVVYIADEQSLLV